MRAELVMVVALAACGRLGFDTTTTDSQSGDGTASDETASGSGGSSGSGDGGLVDALSAACAQAIPISLNTPVTIDTCATNLDQIDACGPVETREVVFKFTAPSRSSYTIRAYTTGTTNVANATGIVDATCTTTSGCAAVMARPFTEGQVVYLAVEASSGTCATIDFLID